MDLIARPVSAEKEGRGRIVGTQIPLHPVGIGVGITVAAQMRTGIISADIRTQHAGALPAPLVFSFWDIQPGVQCSFKGSDRHAAIAVDAVRFKLCALGTGADRHAMGLADLSEGLSKGDPICIPSYRKQRSRGCEEQLRKNSSNLHSPSFLAKHASVMTRCNLEL